MGALKREGLLPVLCLCEILCNVNFYGPFNFDYIQGLVDDLVLGCGS